MPKVNGIDYTQAEFEMQVLNTLLRQGKLYDEERNAIEYAIDCIKTLQDMGVIK